MKTINSIILSAGLFLSPYISIVDAQTAAQSSVKREIERALDKAVIWLCDQQMKRVIGGVINILLLLLCLSGRSWATHQVMCRKNIQIRLKKAFLF